MTIMSSGSRSPFRPLSANVTPTISCFAIKDFPEPDTPNTNPLPLSSSFRLAIMRFLLMTFWP